MDFSKSVISGLVLVGLITGALSQCTEFPEIDEARWDRNYTDITKDGMRPLGYIKAIAPFGNPNMPNPCFTLSNTDARQYEINFETVPSQYLCIRDQAGDEVCSEGRFTSCMSANAGSVSITFYNSVADGSGESDITFWARLTRGPPYEEDTEEMWCHERNTEYPEDLSALPPIFVPPTPRPSQPTGAATSFHISTALISLTTLVISVIYS